MTNKTRKIIVTINTSIICFMVAGGAIAKLIRVNMIEEDLSKLGVGDYLPLLGIAELAFLGLLLYPKTMRIGYLLLCGYFGGAMATHLSHDSSPLQPAIPLVFITLSIILRDRQFFAPRSTQFINY